MILVLVAVKAVTRKKFSVPSVCSQCESIVSGRRPMAKCSVGADQEGNEASRSEGWRFTG